MDDPAQTQTQPPAAVALPAPVPVPVPVSVPVSVPVPAALGDVLSAEKSPGPHSPLSGAGIPGLFLLDGPEADPMALDAVAAEGGPDARFTVQDFVFAVETVPAETVPAPPAPPAPPETAPPAPADPPAPQTDADQAFLAAGEANRTDAAAEWHLDSSASGSSDSSDSDSDPDDSDDDSDDDDYPLMDHAQLAKLLMREDGEDGEDGGGGGGAHKEGLQGPLKTKNELPDTAPPARPDIVVTPAMPLSLLGAVEAVVDSLVLIKACVSGAHQVLNEGSLLVLADRSVFGVVADTLGRVEAPLYTVRFAAPEDVPASAVVGTDVFYVPQHSDYVFTQALHGLKGSDASNIFDEEVADGEREFSDDEAEAEHKRQRKYVRQARDKGGRGGGASRPGADDLYTPLARPSNLAELMSGPPPVASGSGGNRERGGHGRGRGRGRARGQRPARARDDFRARAREAPYQPRPEPQQHYPPQHYQHQPYPPLPPPQQQQQYPQQQYPPQQWSPPPVPPQFPPYQQQQQQQQQQQHGFYHTQPPPPPPQFPPALPQGAHVNPAFLPPPGRNDFNWTPPVPQGGVGVGAGGGGGAGDTGAALKALQNLVSLRNQMQQQQQPPPPSQG